MRTIEIGSAARALTPISAFNNLFLITAIYSIAGAAEDLIRGRLGFGMLVGYALLAPPLWLAWRTMDPIRAVFSNLAFSIYVYTGALASAAVLIGLSILTQQEDINAFLALSCAIYIPFAFAAALGVRRLKKSMIAPFGLSLAALMDRAGENSPRQKTARCPRLNPMRGWTLLAIGALVFLSRAILVDFAVDMAGDNHGKGLGALQNIDQILTLLGCYVLMRARANFQPKAEGLLSVDRRPATLLLRSFSDDEKLRALRTSQYALFDFSLEGRLAGHFAASGPFIAVGSPSHETPPAGAARAFPQRRRMARARWSVDAIGASDHRGRWAHQVGRVGARSSRQARICRQVDRALSRESPRRQDDPHLETSLLRPLEQCGRAPRGRQNRVSEHSLGERPA